MPRPRLALLYIVRDGISELYDTFRRQRVGSSLVVAFVVFLLAMVFSFLAFSPVLSPFVYPLF